MIITIYGASDDLIEVAGDLHDEFYLVDNEARLRVTAPDGESLDVVLSFGTDAGVRGIYYGLDWKIAIEALQSYPAWQIVFHERPDREGDPAVTLTVPEGTQVELVGES